MDLQDYVNIQPLPSISLFHAYSVKTCLGVPGKGFDAIMNYPDNFKFDLVVHDFVCGPCLLGLLPKFNYPPLIGITAFSNPSFTVDIVGGHKYPAYIPMFMMPWGMDMKFHERIYNTILLFWDD